MGRTIGGSVNELCHLTSGKRREYSRSWSRFLNFQVDPLTKPLDGVTFSDVPSENVARSIADPLVDHPDGSDRRGRKRLARREALLESAADIVATSGVDGLTMAALAEASDYAPASLYTYFPSRSALVAALQQRALIVLARVARDSVTAWDESLTGRSTTAVAALARLWAFSRLLLTAPEHHPREFMLQQQLLVSPDAEEVSDAALVVPVAMTVLDVPRSLLERARLDDALNGGVPTTGPLGDEVDIDLLRTLTWLTSLNGALLADGLATGLPATGSLLGAELTRALMIGWGAAPELVETARQLAMDLEAPGAITTGGSTTGGSTTGGATTSGSEGARPSGRSPGPGAKR